jgi:hypothetical protein
LYCGLSFDERLDAPDDDADIAALHRPHLAGLKSRLVCRLRGGHGDN